MDWGYAGRVGHRFVRAVHDWQDLGAGILGLVAAFTAVLITRRTERAKARRESESMKRALREEVRMYAQRALEAFDFGFGELKDPENYPTKSFPQIPKEFKNWTGKIELSQLENKVRFRPPIIYPNAVNVIGQTGIRSGDIVVFYACIESVGRELGLYEVRPPKSIIKPEFLWEITECLSEICDTAVRVIPALEVAAGEDDADGGSKQIEALKSAVISWRKERDQLPGAPEKA